MAQFNNQAVDRLEKKFTLERELLVKCTTKFGAFERIASRILPLLRNDSLTMDLVLEWDRQNRDGTLLRQACQELYDAYKEIVENKVVHHSYSYQAMRAMVEARRKGSCFDVLKSQSPCHRIYYKLRTIYVNAISKNWEVPFAPTALRYIQETTQAELALKCDADPRHTWMQLSVFEECWSIRNDQKCIAWPRAKGKGIDMLLDADRVYRIARRCRLAADFSFLDNPDRKTEFFQRDVLEQWVERLLNEIILILRDRVAPSTVFDPDSLAVNRSSKSQVGDQLCETQNHWRTAHLENDLKVLCPYAESLWRRVIKRCRTKEDVELLSQPELAEILEEEALSIPTLMDLLSPSGKKKLLARCERAMKETHPRKYKDGLFIGLKADYSWGGG
jgi:hypothetical protein